MARPTFQSVSEYIAKQPAHVRALLVGVRKAIKKALPRATEGISYQIPVYRLDERMVLYFAGYARHYAIYPATPALVAALGKAAEGALFHRATLRFPVDRPVPSALIARIAKLRAAEVLGGAPARAGGAKKKSKQAAKATKARTRARARPVKQALKKAARE